MARDLLLTRVELTNIHCHDEADGPGSAEPYLWTVFFKVDGTTVSVSDALTLSGQATTHFTPGSHGNLINTDVDDGDDLPIPSPIGEWQSILTPISVPDSLSDLVEDVGGVVGVVVALMEEDNVSDSGVQAGHGAFNDAVRSAINQIVATRTISNQDVSDSELAQFEGQVSDAVSNAVQSQQNIFQDLWAWLNADDAIGFKAFVFTHDDLAANGSIDFSQRWHNEGDWEITGSITATVICPAEALEDFFEALFGADSREMRLRQLRRFRDGPFRDHPQLQSWWTIIERNMPAFVHVLRKDPDLRLVARQVLSGVCAAAADLTSPLDHQLVETAAKLASDTSRRTRSRRLRIDAARGADLLNSVRGNTGREVLMEMERFEPARHTRGVSKFRIREL